MGIFVDAYRRIAGVVGGVPRLFASQVAVLFGAPFIVTNEPDGELSEGAGKRGSATGYTRVDIPRASVDRDGYLAKEDFADFASGAGAFSRVRTVTADTEAAAGDVVFCDQASVGAAFVIDLDPADAAPAGSVIALQAVRPLLGSSHTARTPAGTFIGRSTDTEDLFGDGVLDPFRFYVSNGVNRWLRLVPNPRDYPASAISAPGTFYGSAAGGGNWWFFGGDAAFYAFAGMVVISGSDGIEFVGVEYFSEQDAPATPAAGTAVRWLDAVTHKMMIMYDDGVAREVLTSP